MKYLILLMLFKTPFISYSQNINGITVGVSKGLADLKEEKGNFSTSFDNYKISIGIQLFKKLNTEVELGFMNMNRRAYNGSYTSNIKTLKLGLDLNYRFIENSIVSPKIAIEGGFFPYSNMKDKHVLYSETSSDLLIDIKNKSKSIFESWKGYADVQLFLSVKLTNIYLDIGGGIGYMAYSFKDNDRHNLFGSQMTFKLSYVFPLNKKSKIKD